MVIHAFNLRRLIRVRIRRRFFHVWRRDSQIGLFEAILIARSLRRIKPDPVPEVARADPRCSNPRAIGRQRPELGLQPRP